MRSRRLAVLLFGICLAVSCFAGSTFANPRAESEGAFSAAAEAISRGAYSEAIDQLELLADRGFLHPDASFNRGIAYLARARSTAARPGDRGRAIASFREAALLRPDDRQAHELIDEIRDELGKQRARQRAQQHVDAPTPTRTLVGLLPENSWAALAVFFSAATAIGLGLRFFRRRQSAVAAGSWQLAGSIIAGVGLFGLLLTGSATALARSLRMHTQTAIVIVDDARLLDAKGRPLSRPPLPEGAEIHLIESQGALAQVEQSSGEAWVRRSDIRVLVTPSTPIDAALH